jgi:hypothetical protein
MNRFRSKLALLPFLMAGCATGPIAPLVPAENASYLKNGSGQIKGLVLVNGAPAKESTIYLCPDTQHFSDWAARAAPWWWEPGKLPTLGADEGIYVRKTKTDVAGRFSFFYLPPGSYIVLKANRGTKKVVRLQDGQIIEVKLNSSVYEGAPEGADPHPPSFYFPNNFQPPPNYSY